MSSGRFSELFGDISLDRDITVRTYGFIEPRSNLEYHSNRWMKEEVEKDSRERLMLMPEAGSTL